VTGRVCPQESQCEAKCILGKKGEPVAIGRLERFAADFERRAGKPKLPELPPPSGKRWPSSRRAAGLTVAGDLVKLGHKITVFEALQEPGGVSCIRHPEFRLPKEIVKYEVDYLRNWESRSSRITSSARPALWRSSSRAGMTPCLSARGPVFPCLWASRVKTLWASTPRTSTYEIEPHEGLPVPRIWHGAYP